MITAKEARETLHGPTHAEMSATVEAEIRFALRSGKRRATYAGDVQFREDFQDFVDAELNGPSQDPKHKNYRALVSELVVAGYGINFKSFPKEAGEPGEAFLIISW